MHFHSNHLHGLIRSNSIYIYFFCTFSLTLLMTQHTQFRISSPFCSFFFPGNSHNVESREQTAHIFCTSWLVVISVCTRNGLRTAVDENDWEYFCPVRQAQLHSSSAFELHNRHSGQKNTHHRHKNRGVKTR